ncbi:heat-inducible transcriptional repressor HrcA [Granulicella mallensis]|uniref:Heat-inducible transcription repressor HrcA n=1 Tax=Granulicella mallensis (strain ATCC BAA-1857 / DSM 23137 / MP5ACTX8) TaxID=682795 RepID=G8NWZ9_GRAMM|nr:heat-inducible transcriptional repressor HrcA [Granulicella mallensis]AEU35527.1 heat-inducible transcription repressor HrcA [Granulicella mallensis MP5ACTX8]
MAGMNQMTIRQRQILTAIVENYISTGEPVSSGTIARSQAFENGAMSAATIRNEMADLADAGMLEQPHTSAGRIPSAEAFRMYVAQLHGGFAGRLPGLSLAEVQSQIDSSFAGVAGAQALLARTSHVLATLSSGVGLAIGAIANADLLEHVHFSRLAARRVLAVLVTRSGMVRDRVLSIDRDLSLRELETAANFLNEHYRGWNIERVRAELAQRLERERSDYRELAQQLWAGTVPEAAHAEQAVYVEGVANLVGLPEDRAQLREMLAALETKQRLVELLNAYIDSRQESVRVVFDLEEQAPEMAGLVLIAAPARVGGESVGTVGVIGPKRMHYENAMSAVSYIAQVFDRISSDVTGGMLGPPPL